MIFVLAYSTANVNAATLTTSKNPIDANPNTLRIATARSAFDLGIIEYLAKEFQRKYPHINIHLTHGGVLKVIEDGKNGQADVVFTHHQPSENILEEQGYGLHRTKIMYTEYALLGPSDSDLPFGKLNNIVEVLQLLSQEEVDFLVPSPKSGTYMKVAQLWASAGIDPNWLGYESTGSSGFATLHQAGVFSAFSIIEMGTYLENKSKVQENISVLYRGDVSLRNTYSLTIINPNQVKNVSVASAKLFLDYLVSDIGQQNIKYYGENKYNSTVFIPAARFDQGLIKRRANESLSKEKEFVNHLKLTILGIVALFVLIAFLFSRNRNLKKVHLMGELRGLEIERERDESLMMNKALEAEIKERERIEKVLSDTLNSLQQSEINLHEAKEKAEITLQSIGDAVITTDVNGNIEFVNEVAEHLIGKPREELIGKNVKHEIHVIDEISNKIIENTATRCLTEKIFFKQEKDHVLVRTNGNQLAIIESAAPIHDKDENFIGVVMIIHDVSNSRKMARELNFHATHDGLTGVFNRRAFEMHVESAIVEATNSDNIHALCFIDMDKFKIVNDSCGHKEGDKLLKVFAALMQERLRENDIFARLGGDEFGILLRYCDINKALDIANDLRRTIKEFRFVVEEQIFDIGISIGIVEITKGEESLSQILSNADIACYVAKDRGGNSVYLYKQDDKEIENRHGNMKWATRIKQALENDDFTLYYQPIVTLKPDIYTKTCYELLLRLNNHDGQVLLPSMLIPAAERYGLMSKIDLRNIRHTLSFLENNKIDNNSIFFINLSGHSIASSEFYDSVNQLFEQYTVSANNLCFEITETAVIANINKANKFIKHFRKKGVLFALDDFGTGLSSFSYLKNLNVDFIKIDGGFAISMLNDLISHAVVETTIKMGKTVGTTVIVECVENKEIMNRLVEFDADYVQGNYLQPPKPLQQWTPYNKNQCVSTKHVKPKILNNITEAC